MEEQINHIEELEGLNTELEGFISDLKGREEGYSSRIADLEAALAETKAQAVSFASALQEARAALVGETSRSAALSSERDYLASKLESVSRLLDEEKGRSAEKDIFINSSRSAIRDREAESENIWKAMEEMKGELASERAAVRDREDRLQRAVKAREELERKLEQAARDAERSKDGFLLKIDLVKKELKEQTLRGEELGRGLAAAGARLDEALEDGERKEKLLAELRALAEKEALQKTASQKILDLSKEAEGLRGGRGKESAGYNRELAAALAERVRELETELSGRAADSLEKFRASQAALAEAQSALRRKEEENASLRAREGTSLKDLRDAEEKWKLSAVQLHDAVAKLRAAENENEINAGRITTIEAERDKFRAAALKAETAASLLADRQSLSRDGEDPGLMAALKEQASSYSELLSKYDGLLLANEALSREAESARAEAAALRARPGEAGAGRGQEKAGGAGIRTPCSGKRSSSWRRLAPHWRPWRGSATCCAAAVPPWARSMPAR